MYRAEVMGTSKVIIDQMKARERRKHLKEVRDAKSKLDNTAPVTMNIPKRNLKKEQMIEDRYTEIERANRILLEKMSNIIVGKLALYIITNCKFYNLEIRLCIIYSSYKYVERGYNNIPI